MLDTTSFSSFLGVNVFGVQKYRWNSKYLGAAYRDFLSALELPIYLIYIILLKDSKTRSKATTVGYRLQRQAVLLLTRTDRKRHFRMNAANIHNLNSKYYIPQQQMATTFTLPGVPPPCTTVEPSWCRLRWVKNTAGRLPRIDTATTFSPPHVRRLP